MPTSLKTHDEYLTQLSDEKRRALEKLRKDIKAAAPQVEECISYGVPSYRLNGKFLMSCGASAKHVAFYPGATVQRLRKELKGYDTSKGTIRFPAEKPLPAALVRKIVKKRIAEQQAKTKPASRGAK